jgi:glycosyltransferase involved in cell wall biosynthesis
VTVVAVCIPAFDEVEGIARVVTSVRSCGYPAESLRVIVAVDGGNPDVVAAAEAAGAEVCVVHPNQGSYSARNAAVARAGDATVLCFTDADCTVAPGWIDAHLRTLEHCALSGGGVQFVFSEDPPRPAEWVDAFRHLKQELYVTKEHYAATANLAVRRAVFDDMQFDPTLRTGGDADFGRRAHAAGHDIAYTPDARVLHPARVTTQDLLKKVRRLATGAARARRLRGVASRRPRLTRSAYRAARAAGYDVGAVWGARVCALEYRAQWVLYRAVRRTSLPEQS